MSTLRMVDRQRGVYVAELASELHRCVQQIAEAQAAVSRIAGMLPYADGLSRPLPDDPATTDAPMTAKQVAGASAYDDDGELASAPSTKTCPGGGGTTTFRSGRNKAGKDYSGYFCDTKCGAAPQWIDTKGGQR